MCGCLWHAPPLGTWPASQACASTGNQISDLLVHRSVLSPLSYTSQGTIFFNIKKNPQGQNLKSNFLYFQSEFCSLMLSWNLLKFCILTWAYVYWLQREKKGEEERNINVREKHRLVASCMHPDWESNLQHFGAWCDTPTNQATWPGLIWSFEESFCTRKVWYAWF